MARRFPHSRIVAVSNSRSQKAWIEERARSRGLGNVRVITADMNTFEAPGSFDRIVSVEMFEHMRNWRALLANVVRWLADEGRIFIHIFTHQRYAYLYEVRDRSDWMAEYFFTGGIMPSDRLIYEFGDLVSVIRHWQVSGVHYQRTAEAWLANMDRHRAEIWPILERTYGRANARRWWVRWRVFFMACAELWGYRDGSEWGVSHYLLRKA
jgi:cyclopropane-fatty-acyl-phospholipid synthase